MGLRFNPMNIKQLLFCFLVSSCSLGIFAQNNQQKAKEYIQDYADLAVMEMERSGIPASISLAQGMLESDLGRSFLAKEAKNHFGIKCKIEWTGPSVRATDDAPDECFRKYDQVSDSYRDHSKFIRYNRLRYYDHLFDLAPGDYKAWAYGLQKAGYATAKDYAKRLIQYIDQFNLHQYDLQADALLVAEVLNQSLDENRPEYFIPEEYKEMVEANRTNQANTIHFISDAAQSDQPQVTRVSNSSKNNSNSTQELDQNQASLSSSQPFHEVNSDDSMESIAKQYQLDLKRLYALNMLVRGSQPAVGERISLRKQMSSPPKLKKIKYPPKKTKPK